MIEILPNKASHHSVSQINVISSIPILGIISSRHTHQPVMVHQRPAAVTLKKKTIQAKLLFQCSTFSPLNVAPSPNCTQKVLVNFKQFSRFSIFTLFTFKNLGWKCGSGVRKSVRPQPATVTSSPPVVRQSTGTKSIGWTYSLKLKRSPFFANRRATSAMSFLLWGWTTFNWGDLST